MIPRHGSPCAPRRIAAAEEYNTAAAPRTAAAAPRRAAPRRGKCDLDHISTVG
jgi:hypothetical protein